MSVPESDVTVSGAATSCQETILMRTPADSLDSCCVFMELDQRLVGVQIPNHKFIIVTSGGELLIVEAPLQATDFLLVAFKLAEVRVGSSQISLQNVSVSASCAHS